MTKHLKTQVDYTTKTKNFQLFLPLNVEINISADDSVRLLSNVLEKLDCTELYRTYSRKEKNNAVSPKNLFKVLVYAYMCNLHSTRQIETACKRDINFMYLLEGTKASTGIQRTKITQQDDGQSSETIFIRVENSVKIKNEIKCVRKTKSFISYTKNKGMPCTPLQNLFILFYFVPNRRSPASPRPGIIYASSLRHSSSAPV